MAGDRLSSGSSPPGHVRNRSRRDIVRSIRHLLVAFFIGNASLPAWSEGSYGLAIHGGAGTISRASLSPGQEAAYLEQLTLAVNAGNAVLAGGGKAIDAVVAAILVMEDSTLFNAGRGAVYTHGGGHELDASLMQGEDLAAGAVAGVSDVRNPILLAREILQYSPHVMLSGEGASQYAAERGLARVKPDWFGTERRYRSWQKANGIEPAQAGIVEEDYKFGTVGAVALDRQGNLAAGTSTGGMTNKRYGRIGDSPVIGAGTYANNESCAVSATGHGEYFIRYTVAHDICARMQYGALTLEQAAQQVVNIELVDAGGDGGIIAIDRDGQISLVFNSEGMYRAYSHNGAAPTAAIYRD